MTTTPSGPPVVRDERSAAFFDAAAEDVLLIKRCTTCGHWLGPEARTCTRCGRTELDWAPACGTAELVTWSIVHHPPHPAFAEQVPFPIGVVELTEGPWLTARISASLDELRAGMPLQVRFVHPDEGESYPIFAADHQERRPTHAPRTDHRGR
ncbi:OB-fold domain-containing protein [Nocardia sp. R7R-8]|uniref:OB-fold domain-containing protein n=1 Tax=Nocardia sp. R7R-8 TaxID=3459304 RepID=UPI00403DF02E